MESMVGWLTGTPGGRFTAVALGVAIILVVAWILQRLVGAVIPDVRNQRRVRKLVLIVAVMLALIFISSVFGANLSNLTLALGLIGAGIAFAIQEVIASVAGWLTILLTRFYTVGDRVELG